MTNIDDVKIYDVLREVPNRFLLSVAVAKRARQLKEGAKPMVAVNENQDILPVLTAMREIKAKKINVFIQEQPEDELLDDINDYVDFDLDEPAEEKPKKETKSKSKSKSLAA
jgi:DNA-directed RNA polymerase omega subunit